MYKNESMKFFREMENEQEKHGIITFYMLGGETHELYNQIYTTFIKIGNDVKKAKIGKDENTKIMGHMACGNEEVFIDLTMVSSVRWEE